MSVKSIIIKQETQAKRIAPDKVQLDLLAVPLNEENDAEPQITLQLYINDELIKTLTSSMDWIIKEQIIIDNKAPNEDILVRLEDMTSSIQSKIKSIMIEPDSFKGIYWKFSYFLNGFKNHAAKYKVIKKEERQRKLKQEEEMWKQEMQRKLEERWIEISKIFRVPMEEALGLVQIEKRLFLKFVQDPDRLKLTLNLKIGTATSKMDDGTGEMDDESYNQNHPFRRPSYPTEDYSLSLPNLKALTRLDSKEISELPITNNKFGKYIGKEFNIQLVIAFYQEIIGPCVPKENNYSDFSYHIMPEVEIIADFIKASGSAVL